MPFESSRKEYFLFVVLPTKTTWIRLAKNLDESKVWVKKIDLESDKINRGFCAFRILRVFLDKKMAWFLACRVSAVFLNGRYAVFVFSLPLRSLDNKITTKKFQFFLVNSF